MTGEKLRILLTSYMPYKESGGAISTYNLAKALKKLGHKVFIASTKEYPKDIETILMPSYKKTPLLEFQERVSIRFFKKIINTKKIDIIHAQSRLTIPGAILAAKDTGISSVIHFRAYDWLCPKSTCLSINKTNCDLCSYSESIKCSKGKMKIWNLYKFRYLKSRWNLLKEADAKISISNHVASKYKKINVDSIVINNIRELKIPKKTNFKKEFNLRKIVLTYLGRIENEKGTVVLLKSIKDILKKREDVSLFIAGSGKDKEKLKEIIEKEGLNEKVVVQKIPFERVPELYSVTDIVLFSSLWEEPFSGIPLEAMCAGKPIIASNRGGTVDSVVDGKTGYLINPENKKAWQEKLTKLLDNKKLREKIGKEAKKRAKLFSSEKIGKEVEDVYYSILEKNKT